MSRGRIGGHVEVTGRLRETARACARVIVEGRLDDGETSAGLILERMTLALRETLTVERYGQFGAETLMAEYVRSAEETLRAHGLI